MKIFYLLFISCIILTNPLKAQEIEDLGKADGLASLFQIEKPLAIKLTYSTKEIKQDTNDSTYLNTDLSYQSADGVWNTIAVEIRARGNYRRAKCDFPPLKLKIKKSTAKGTPFEGTKKLKMVLPCLKLKNLNDDLIKEFLAYKVYELVTPYHFKTRMIRFYLTETKGKKSTNYEMLGFFVEDDKSFEKRFHGQELERFTHPQLLDTLTSVQNAFFQYLIGNTDYSMVYRHNEKLFRINGSIVPVPYDFDMTGLVDPRYAVVSEVQNEKLPIEDVTHRLYRGFKRDPDVFQQVREQYLDNKDDVFELLDDYQSFFSDPKEFDGAREFVLEFFEVLENDKKFQRLIVERARIE
jgi:hypothetical protein